MRVTLFAIFIHILNELELIIYYSTDLDLDTDSKEEIVCLGFIFVQLLPLTIHYWIFMISIYPLLCMYSSAILILGKNDGDLSDKITDYFRIGIFIES